MVFPKFFQIFTLPQQNLLFFFPLFFVIPYFLTIFQKIDKIKALNTIHAEKVRSLMNSIALLKKETQSLKKASQEHKRSELITGLNKEIADQDLIIETLRIMIHNDDAADKEIVRVLTKGPPKIRVETREELKIEIRKLKAQLAKYLAKKDETGNENAQKPGESMNLERRNSTDTQMSVKTEFNENFFQQIDTLKKENEELRLNLKAKQVIIERFEDENTEKLEELKNLRLIKTDFAVITKKYETLQKEYDEKIRVANDKKFVITYDKEMRLEELEIINKTQQGKLNLVEKNVEFELNNCRQKMEDLDKKNKELQLDNDQVLKKYDELLQRNKTLNEDLKRTRNEYEAYKKDREAIISRHEQTMKALRDDLDNMEQEKNDFESENVSLNNTIFMLKGEIKKLTVENNNLNRIIMDLKEELKSLYITQNNERDIGTSKAMQEDLSAIEKVSQKGINVEKPKFANVSTEFIEENKILKRKLKELTIRQIELTEKSEAMELELRLRGRKESNAFIKARQQERQIQKIQNMHEELKSKSTFQRMDSNLSHVSKNLENSKMLDSNLSYSQSISKMDSKISTPIRSEGLIDTDSDITSENKDLRKVLKKKQEDDLNLKIKVEALEKELKTKTGGKENKKDLNAMENEKKIKDLAEKISNISFNNSDISRSGSIRNSSVIDSNVSNLDSNIESIVSNRNGMEKIETDSNVSGFGKK